MPLPPIDVSLSDAQKLDTLKRFYQCYHEEREEIEGKITEMKTAEAESTFAAQYLGEQKEVVDLRPDPAALETLEKRRQHLGILIERLQQVLPKQDGDSPATFTRF